MLMRLRYLRNSSNDKNKKVNHNDNQINPSNIILNRDHVHKFRPVSSSSIQRNCKKINNLPINTKNNIQISQSRPETANSVSRGINLISVDRFVKRPLTGTSTCRIDKDNGKENNNIETRYKRYKEKILDFNKNKEVFFGN